MIPVEFIKAKFILLTKKNNVEWYISTLGIFIVISLLWLPFGLKNTDIADGWTNVNIVDKVSSLQIFLRIFRNTSRPFVYIPWKLAMTIAPDSFLGVQVMFALSFWGKAFVFYAILRKLRLATPSMTFLMTILFILFPADQGNFLMSAFGRHVAVFFYLLSVLMLILACQHRTMAYLLGMALAEAISALISEQGFLVMLVTPAVLLLNSACTKHRKGIVAFVWYLFLSFGILNFVEARKTYQTRLLGSGLFADRMQYIKEVVFSSLQAYRQIFVDGWLIAIDKLTGLQWKYILFALVIALVVGCISYLLICFEKAQTLSNEIDATRSFVPVVTAGLLIIGLSFIPYAITSYRYRDFRVFYYAAIGGALIVGHLFIVVTGRLALFKRASSFLLWSITIFIISFNGLTQHARQVAQSQIQQKALISIVEQAPIPQWGSVIVLLEQNEEVIPLPNSDQTLEDFYKGRVFRYTPHFNNAIKWIYDRMDIRGVDQTDLIGIEIKRAIIFRYTKDGDVILLEEIPAEYIQEGMTGSYRPYKRIKTYVPFPERGQKAFDVKPNPDRLAPRSWVRQEQSLNDRRVCNVSHSGNCSLLFYGADTLTTFSQKIDLSGDANEQIELSFWIKSEDRIDPVPIANLKILYDDGSEDVLKVSDKLTKSWTMQQLSFKTDKAYSGLVLELFPDSTSSLIWVDDVQLTKGNVELLVKNPSFEK